MNSHTISFSICLSAFRNHRWSHSSRKLSQPGCPLPPSTPRVFSSLYISRRLPKPDTITQCKHYLLIQHAHSVILIWKFWTTNRFGRCRSILPSKCLSLSSATWTLALLMFSSPCLKTSSLFLLSTPRTLTCFYSLLRHSRFHRVDWLGTNQNLLYNSLLWILRFNGLM